MVAANSNLLSALTKGLTVSTQALDLFYQVPPFLLPIYQAAGVQYGVPWEVLAAINEVETDYGNDLSVSTAGAVGWMQFMPATWLQYGVDALDAGYADPYNPVDAIFAAARYLAAAGASQNLRQAVFAYNHSEEYVESVMLRARLLATYPPSAIATLTGLVESVPPLSGAHVVPGTIDAAAFTAGAGKAAGASSATASAVAAPSPPSAATAPSPSSAAGGAGGQVSQRGVTGSRQPLPAPAQFVELEGAAHSSVVAVQSGRVVALGHSRALGRYIALEDVYGDVFTYAGLGSVASRYRTAQSSEGAPTAASVALHTAGTLGTPSAPASAGSQTPLTLRGTGAGASPSAKAAGNTGNESSAEEAPVESSEGSTNARGPGKVLLYADPGNPDARVVESRLAARQDPYGQGWAPLRVGAVVSQGTALGTPESTPAAGGAGGSVGPSASAGASSTEAGASAGTGAGAGAGASPGASATAAGGVAVGAGARGAMLRFAIRPAGDTSAVDPQPLIENWGQLQRALHPQGAKAGTGLLGATADDVFLLSQGQLERAVLADPTIGLPSCARHEVAAGHVNGRVLALLLFLSRSGLSPTVSALRCAGALPRGGGLYSAIDRGEGVDISKIGGVPVAEHQGAGTITDLTIRTMLSLQGHFAPHRIVSLMRYPGAPSTQASPDHASFIEVDFPPEPTSAPSANAATAAHSAGPGATAPSPLAVSLGLRSAAALTSAQWNQLVERIAALPRPKVPTKPSSAAIRDPRATASAPRPGH